MLQPFYSDQYPIEIGVDEAGRGPLFGRLYVAAAVLPKSADAFRHEDMKDSKRFSSATKIKKVAQYIKDHAIAWSVQYIDADVIDAINIRQSVLRAMHACCADVIDTLQCSNKETLLLVDGNDFTNYLRYDQEQQELVMFPHVTVEKGDNTYTSIAAASILAKVARDDYIEQLCDTNPQLDAKYGLRKNKGYGTAAHMAGLAEHGLSEWHRKTFCRKFSYSGK